MRSIIASALAGAAALGAGFFLLSASCADEPRPAQAASIDIHALIPPFNPRLDAVRAPTGFGTGQVWHVGPNQQYKKPSEVAPLVHDGDVVEIDAARYACDAGVKWSANDLSLVGVGGRPVLDATHCEIPGDKGIWNPRGKGLIVDNIEFVGAAGPSRNDAGIRYDGAGYVYIANSYFHDNEDGLLATPSDGAQTDLVIERCEFAHNGGGDGYTHNMYISTSGSGQINSFVLRFSYSHDAHVGHEVKTRADANYILYNRLADEQDGDSSYDIDVPQGGLTYIIGNVIQHGAHAQNYAMISYSAEGMHNPVQEIHVVNNTFVSEIPNRGIAVNLYDHGLGVAEMANNLAVGISPANLVGVTPAKMTLSHNVVTSTPGFYDQANRNYYLTANSEAVHAGTDPGTAHGFALAPMFEFGFPATGMPRPASGALDAGAYAYQPGQKIAPLPAIQFSAQSPIDYATPATLTWSATDALYCAATGDWSGSQAASGRYTSAPLTSHASYGLSCTGAGGSSSKSVTVAVNQSPEAAGLGAYAWRHIPGSALASVCAAAIRDASGAYVYQDDFGTASTCDGRGSSATGVYVPDTETWYLLGGAGGRNYYGNEVYGFDVAALKPELVTLPDHISGTKEYVPSDVYGSKIHLPGCDAILHLAAGGVVPAASGISGTAAWNPLTKKIVVGPGAFVKGAQCSVAVNGGTEVGQMTTDLWSFAPPESSRLPETSAAAWQLLAPDNNGFGSVAVPLWFFDPATGIGYLAGNRSYADRGGFLIDFSHVPPKSALVSSVWPFGADVSGASAIDTGRHYAMVVGNGSIAMWNLNGLSLTKYGPKTPFDHEDGWTITGNKDLLSDPHHPGLTYNPKLKAFVAWAGSPAVYFLYPDYRTKKIKIVAKMDIDGGPADPNDDLDGKFIYIAKSDLYLVFTGVEHDFYFLVPPTNAETTVSDPERAESAPPQP